MGAPRSAGRRRRARGTHRQGGNPRRAPRPRKKGPPRARGRGRAARTSRARAASTRAYRGRRRGGDRGGGAAGTARGEAGWAAARARSVKRARAESQKISADGSEDNEAVSGRWRTGTRARTNRLRDESHVRRARFEKCFLGRRGVTTVLVRENAPARPATTARKRRFVRAWCVGFWFLVIGCWFLGREGLSLPKYKYVKNQLPRANAAPRSSTPARVADPGSESWVRLSIYTRPRAGTTTTTNAGATTAEPQTRDARARAVRSPRVAPPPRARRRAGVRGGDAFGGGRTVVAAVVATPGRRRRRGGGACRHPGAPRRGGAGDARRSRARDRARPAPPRGGVRLGSRRARRGGVHGGPRARAPGRVRVRGARGGRTRRLGDARGVGGRSRRRPRARLRSRRRRRSRRPRVVASLHPRALVHARLRLRHARRARPRRAHPGRRARGGDPERAPRRARPHVIRRRRPRRWQ